MLHVKINIQFLKNLSSVFATQFKLKYRSINRNSSWSKALRVDGSRDTNEYTLAKRSLSGSATNVFQNQAVIVMMIYDDKITKSY